MENIEKLKAYMKRLIGGEKAVELAYSAIEKDDSEGLSALIDCGLSLRSDNFVFSAIDRSATKCLDLLLEKNANIFVGGRAFHGQSLLYAEPLEYAVILNDMDSAKKLVAHGAPLCTQSGIDILRKYRKCIGGENCDILRSQREQYVREHSQIER